MTYERALEADRSVMLLGALLEAVEAPVRDLVHRVPHECEEGSVVRHRVDDSRRLSVGLEFPFAGLGAAGDLEPPGDSFGVGVQVGEAGTSGHTCGDRVGMADPCDPILRVGGVQRRVPVGELGDVQDPAMVWGSAWTSRCAVREGIRASYVL